ncbi:MAG: cytochrome c [Sulfurimonas sp.]|uniref:c-type cytochrome n=1 Tax=Sulfurimonas sp. TaxID=2022749 RepID=UPI0025EFB47A|nr:c-type cytochrome [Sulfurimonas sp.]MCK9490924.1 cytochrome c [Sulfurimonas sp.]
MKKILLVTILVTSSLFAQTSDIETLAVEKCGSCHLIGAITKDKLNNMSAPPSWALSKKVKAAYPNKTDAIEFIVEYTMSPSEDKMLFSHKTKERFGIMPSQKEMISEDELRAVAEYIIDN